MRLTSEDGGAYEAGDVPPAGLWISPEGVAIPAVEHMAEIARDPERYGFRPEEVRGATVGTLAAAVARLVRSGWIRFRDFSDAWAFEVDDVRKRLPLIEEVLVAHQALPEDTVRIHQAKPRRDWEGMVGEFYERTLFRRHEVAGVGRRARAKAANRSWRVT